MGTDFPAAHSMDTTWFAVDSKGHVAIFDSWESGAVPVSALMGERAEEMREHLGQLLPIDEAAHDLRGRSNRAFTGEGEQFDHYRQAVGDAPLLLFLTSLDPIQNEIAAGRAMPVAAVHGVAVIWRHPAQALLEALHEGGLCLGCFPCFDDEEGEPPNLACRGVFTYEHALPNGIARSYGRTRFPRRPIHLDQLPPPVREQTSRFRFDHVDFAAEAVIQPLEHGDCESWECAYLDSTGTWLLPVPGHEDEFAKEL